MTARELIATINTLEAQLKTLHSDLAATRAGCYHNWKRWESVRPGNPKDAPVKHECAKCFEYEYANCPNCDRDSSVEVCHDESVFVMHCPDCDHTYILKSGGA